MSVWCVAGVTGVIYTYMEYNVGTSNRFNINDWQTVGGAGRKENEAPRNKRARESTGSNDSDTFNNMSNDEKLSSIFNVVNVTHQKVNDIEQTQGLLITKVDRVGMSIENLRTRVSIVEESIKSIEYKLSKQAHHQIDQEARGMRNNLIFWGITEKGDKDCRRLMYNFLSDMLEIEPDSIYIERAHRFGQIYDREDPKRPIVVLFRDYTDTEAIMRRQYKLKGTRFRFDRQYPKEIADARKLLYDSPEAKEARQGRRSVQIRYPAKLFIQGRLVHDMFPDWLQKLRENRLPENHPVRKSTEAGRIVQSEDNNPTHAHDDDQAIHTGQQKQQTEDDSIYNKTTLDEESENVGKSSSVFDHSTPITDPKQQKDNPPGKKVINSTSIENNNKQRPESEIPKPPRSPQRMSNDKEENGRKPQERKTRQRSQSTNKNEQSKRNDSRGRPRNRDVEQTHPKTASENNKRDETPKNSKPPDEPNTNNRQNNRQKH